MDNNVFDDMIESWLSRPDRPIPKHDIQSDDGRSFLREIQRAKDSNRSFFDVLKDHAEEARKKAEASALDLFNRTGRYVIDDESWSKLGSCLVGVVVTKEMINPCPGNPKQNWYCGKAIYPNYFQAWDVWIMNLRCPSCCERIKAAEEAIQANRRVEAQIKQEKKHKPKR
jgi:hypothetical protein